MASINSVPFDVALCLFSHMSRADIALVASLSRSLRASALPTLYKDVACTIDQLSAWKTISTYPTVALSVRSITILQRSDLDESQQMLLQRFLTKDNEYVFSLMGALKATSKLRAFHWRTREVFSISYKLWEILSEQCLFLESFSTWETQEDLAGFHCAEAKPYLRIQPYTGYICHSQSFVDFQGLRSFSYSLSPFCVPAYHPNYLFGWLTLRHPDLEYLRVSFPSMLEQPWSSKILVRDLHLPKLKKLVLDGINFHALWPGETRNAQWEATILFFERHEGLQEIHLGEDLTLDWLFMEAGSAKNLERAQSILPNIVRTTLNPISLELLLNPLPMSGRFRNITHLRIHEVYDDERLHVNILTKLSYLTELDLSHSDDAVLLALLESCVTANQLEVLTIRTRNLSDSLQDELLSLLPPNIRVLGFELSSFKWDEKGQSFLAAVARDCPGIREVGFGIKSYNNKVQGWLYTCDDGQQGISGNWRQVCSWSPPPPELDMGSYL